MKILAAVMLASLVFQAGLKSQSQKQVSKTWVPAVYHGLVVGRSTRSDVVRVLGKPEWKGNESDTGVPIISYTVSDPVPGTLVVYPRRGILDAMALYPKAPITKKDIVRMLGSKYSMVRYASDDCLIDSGTAPIYESPDGPIKHMEYRNRGLAVSFDGDKVEAIMFVDKPFGPTHSRCRGQQKKNPKEP